MSLAMNSGKASIYHFKDITTVPSAKDLVDIVLSRTQRKTPTVVHPQFKISRIRNFYTRKVKFCQQTYHDKFTQMITEFPRLDDIHPFYADLCNVLYDRDHYKLALGQTNTVRGVIDNVAKDYVRLIKYADSPYKCKMLKRAALGRMCTAVRRLNDAMKYLEEVRQHLSRLPSINPSTRTLILTGYPNVGKSSFVNTVSHANVEVQPYAFTTKSLFVGHFDFNYSRWQVIDTPGLLDHPLSNRNTIELTAITALAHIQAAILFMIDISEQCGFSIESQIALFHSIKVLFRNKPLVIVLNKIDVVKFEDLNDETKELLKAMVSDLPDSMVLEASCLTATGVDAVKNAACEMLLTQRVESKIASKKAEAIVNRLHVTSVTPTAERPPCIPLSVIKKKLRNSAGRAKNKRISNSSLSTRAEIGVDEDDDDDDDDEDGLDDEEEMESCRAAPLARELEEQNGGAGVYSIDLNSEWTLKDSSWKYDIMPEIYKDKNVLDFIDPDIEEKLRELELEEEQLLEQDLVAANANSRAEREEEWKDVASKMTHLYRKIGLQNVINRLKTNLSRKVKPRRHGMFTKEEVEENLRKIGYQLNPKGISAKTLPKRRSVVDVEGFLRQEARQSRALTAGPTNLALADKTTRGVGDDSYEDMMMMSSSTNDDKLSSNDDKLTSSTAIIAKEGEEIIEAKSSMKHKLARMSLARTREQGQGILTRVIRKVKAETPNRITKSLPTKELQIKAMKMKRLSNREFLRSRRAGESDRFIGTKRPKHLYSGKRGIGKTDRR